MESYQGKRKKRKRSSGYSAYFEGYTEAKVPKKNGKGYKIVRIYTDDYYLHEMDDSQWKLLKVILGVLTTLSCALFLWSAYDRSGSNSAVYVILPSGFSLFCQLFLVVHTVEYICEPRRMTVYNCNSSHKGVMRWALLSAVCLSLVFLTTLIYLFIERGKIWRLLWCAMRNLLAALAAGLAYFIESKVSYRQEENDTTLPFYEDADF